MPRWWRRKRRQAKAEPPKGSAAPADSSSRKRQPADSAPETREPEPAAPEAKAPEPEAKPRAQADPPPDPTPRVEAKPEEQADPVDSAPPGESTRPLQPVPPPDPPSPPESDPPPAAAHAADAGSEPEAAAEPPEPDPEAEGTDDDSDLSSLADKVQAVLVAAESTAERIRREAEADSARIAEERERQRHAARELIHLERLADSLSVQAESVKRQCAVLRDLLPAVDDVDEPSILLDRPIAVPDSGDDSDGQVRVRDLRGEREQASGTGEVGAGGDPPENGRRYPEISRERVEAYRMKLAGASRSDVEAYLAAAGVAEAAEITAELFELVAPARSAE